MMNLKLWRLRYLFLLLLLSLFFIAPKAYTKTTPSLTEFTRVYRQNLSRLRARLPADQQDPCAITESFIYSENKQIIDTSFSLAEYCATQSDFSFYKISLELSKDKPSKRTLKYVSYRGRRYLVDGHHHLLLALYAGEETYPSHMVHKFDDKLSPEDFLVELKRLNMIYDTLIDPSLMSDNIYLNKVREIVRDTSLKSNKLYLKGKNTLGDLIGALAPIKPYYAEQRLGEVLKESGYVLKNITPKKIIEIFKKAKKESDPRVADLILLNSPFQITDKKTFEEAQVLIRNTPRRYLKNFCDRLLEK